MVTAHISGGIISALTWSESTKNCIFCVSKLRSFLHTNMGCCCVWKNNGVRRQELFFCFFSFFRKGVVASSCVYLRCSRISSNRGCFFFGAITDSRSSYKPFISFIIEVNPGAPWKNIQQKKNSKPGEVTLLYKSSEIRKKLRWDIHTDVYRR